MRMAVSNSQDIIAELWRRVARDNRTILSIYLSSTDDNKTKETTEKRPIVSSTVRPSACSANPLDMCMYEPPSNAHLTDALDTSEL